jgi:hypothetical protein
MGFVSCSPLSGSSNIQSIRLIRLACNGFYNSVQGLIQDIVSWSGALECIVDNKIALWIVHCCKKCCILSYNTRKGIDKHIGNVGVTPSIDIEQTQSEEISLVSAWLQFLIAVSHNFPIVFLN